MMQFGSTFCSPSSKLLVSNLVLGAPSPVKVWGFPGPHLKGCTTSSIHRKPCWKMFGKSPCGSWFPWFPWIPDSRLILLPRFTVLHLLVQSLVCFLFVTPMHAQHCHNGWMHFQSKNQKKKRQLQLLDEHSHALCQNIALAHFDLRQAMFHRRQKPISRVGCADCVAWVMVHTTPHEAESIIIKFVMYVNPISLATCRTKIIIK